MFLLYITEKDLYIYVVYVDVHSWVISGNNGITPTEIESLNLLGDSSYVNNLIQYASFLYKSSDIQPYRIVYYDGVVEAMR